MICGETDLPVLKGVGASFLCCGETIKKGAFPHLFYWNSAIARVCLRYATHVLYGYSVPVLAIHVRGLSANKKGVWMFLWAWMPVFAGMTIENFELLKE